MDTRPKRLRTLPPDGLVLEDLIGEMRSNYGPPGTPQEYRLIIRTAAVEDKLAEPAAAKPEPARSESENSSEPGEPNAGRRPRRRRRRGGAGRPAGAESVEPSSPQE